GGGGRVRLAEGRRGDPADVVLARPGRERELGDRRAAARVGPLLPALPRPWLRRRAHAGARLVPRAARRRARRQRARPPPARALLRGRRGERLRPSLAGGRPAGPARDGRRVGGYRPTGPRGSGPLARGAARRRPASRGAWLAGAAAGRLALRAGPAARPRGAVPRPHGVSRRQLLESRHAVRARIRSLRGERAAGRRGASLPPRARL